MTASRKNWINHGTFIQSTQYSAAVQKWNRGWCTDIEKYQRHSIKLHTNTVNNNYIFGKDQEESGGQEAELPTKN